MPEKNLSIYQEEENVVNRSELNKVVIEVNATEQIENRIKKGELLQYRSSLAKDHILYESLEGDVFDRQRCIVDWDQVIVENQTALLLGCGGVGSNFALGLVRLGIKELIAIDYDVVDASNLNRQLLFTKLQVEKGMKKCDALQETLESQHNLRTKIVVYHMDVIKNWKKIVCLASGCTVIFNAIDYGSYADCAIAALAFKLSIPYISASTYGNKFQNEYYHPLMATSWRDNNDEYSIVLKKKDIASLYPEKENSSLWKDGLTVENIIYILEECLGMSGPKLESMIYEEFASLGNVPTQPIDIFLNILLPKLGKRISDILSPSSVILHDNLSFVPKDTNDTRSMGSWVGVCTLGSFMSLKAWVQGLTNELTFNSTICDIRHFPKEESTFFSNFIAFTPMISKGQWSAPEERKPKGQQNFEELNYSNKSVIDTEEDFHKCSKTVDELLYFSFIKTGFKVTEGSTSFIGESGYRIACEKSTSKASLNDNNEYHDAATENIILPTLPATDIVPVNPVKDHASIIRELPSNLRKPLLKCKKLMGTNSSFNEEKLPQRYIQVEAYHSGIRSALIVGTDHRWYRLKGCGNYESGITVQLLDSEEVHGVNNENHERKKNLTLRGVCFPTTVYRELFMTKIISKILIQYGFQTANKSTDCCYQYELLREQIKQWKIDKNEHPNKEEFYDFEAIETLNWTGPSCCIFETLGDKRLGDHLLTGFDILIPSLFVLTPESYSCLRQSFLQRGRETAAEEGYVVETYLLSTCQMWDSLLDTETILSLELKVDIEKYLELVGSNFAAETKELWLKTLKKFMKQAEALAARKDVKDNNIIIGNILGYIYKKIGSECGTILGILHHHNINWGTYTDKLGTHCNAHVNNFVILPAGQDKFYSSSISTRNFLAPLDFDMAFSRDQYESESQGDATLQPPIEELFQMEVNALIGTLAGDPFINTGVKILGSTSQETRIKEVKNESIGNTKDEMDQNQMSRLFQMALRDILVNSFRERYNSASEAIKNIEVDPEVTVSAFGFDSFFPDESYLELSHTLIELALIVTSSDIA